ncbi:MAG: HD-GYP domain-containing protein [Clostridiales bacterium]|jgi:putative nucleotidyltransferase with HDIG domain|nr:HD-GYP domain-containing protein [Clostridiales bacterium]
MLKYLQLDVGGLTMYTAARMRIDEVKPEMRLAESLYTTGKNWSMLIARKGTPINRNLIDFLERRDIGKIEVFEKWQPEKLVPVRTVVDKKLKEEAVDSVKQLFGLFGEPDGEINMTTAFHCVSNIESVVVDLLDIVMDESSFGLIHINDLKHYDEYTYHHSLSVAVLSMVTGRELGLDHDELIRLGRCAILHDIGKQLIPLEIINKKGRLTADEFEKITHHPELGANNLICSALGDDELWNSIVCHHEKINGKGYPYKLKGNEIPLFSKIISVADVYDAVTSYRSYRSPMSPVQAFGTIYSDIGESFDYDVVKAFYKKLEFYPPNTIVELTDGTLGIVIAGGGPLKLRPLVRLWGSEKIVNLAASMYKDVHITRVWDPASLPEGYHFF